MNLVIKNNRAIWGDHEFPCTIGENGFTDQKREGDGKTPIGAFAFRQVFYRADRMEKPQTALPLSIITPDCGWCDDPSSPHYNKYIRKPFSASHEDLWLEKSMYDVLVVVGYNDQPPTPHMGSAIFIHLANPEWGPTKGCIGLKAHALLHIISQATTDSRLVIPF